MATRDVSRINRLRGTLIANPTDLTAASPYGGTELGNVRDGVLKWGYKTDHVTAEEFGGVVTEVVHEGVSPILMAVLREFDDDAVATVFPDSFAGSASGSRVVRGLAKGTGAPGTLLSGQSVKLLFAPYSPDSHPFVVLYNAIPMIDESAELQLMAGEESGTAVVFRGAPDASFRIIEEGSRNDLEL